MGVKFEGTEEERLARIAEVKQELIESFNDTQRTLLDLAVLCPNDVASRGLFYGSFTPEQKDIEARIARLNMGFKEVI